MPIWLAHLRARYSFMSIMLFMIILISCHLPISVEQLSLSLEEAKDELQVMKRKNNAAIKVFLSFQKTKR